MYMYIATATPDLQLLLHSSKPRPSHSNTVTPQKKKSIEHNFCSILN